MGQGRFASSERPATNSRLWFSQRRPRICCSAASGGRWPALQRGQRRAATTADRRLQRRQSETKRAEAAKKGSLDGRQPKNNENAVLKKKPKDDAGRRLPRAARKTPQKALDSKGGRRQEKSPILMTQTAALEAAQAPPRPKAVARGGRETTKARAGTIVFPGNHAAPASAPSPSRAWARCG